MPREDLTGKKFNRLTVIKYAGKKGKDRTWNCVCDCGNEIIATTSNLKGNRQKQCSDCAKNRCHLEGKRFGKLTVIKKAYISKNRTYWLCRCDCGKEKNIVQGSLVSGKTSSCGCYANSINAKRMTKHGKYKTRLYRIWNGMKSRCFYSKNPAYKYYGGKGITVCKEWLNFEAFYKWAMDNGYDDSLTIDRVDGNKDYSPSNCRWTTMQQQSDNRNCTIYMTLNNKTMPIREWSKIIGISRGVLYYRKTHGWNDEKSLLTPVKTIKNKEKKK